DAVDAAAEPGEHPQHDARAHAVRIDDRCDIVAAGGSSGGLGLDHRQRAGGLAHRHGVDEHEGVVTVEQFVGEVNTADAGVGDLHAAGPALTSQARGNLDAEAVV